MGGIALEAPMYQSMLWPPALISLGLVTTLAMPERAASERHQVAEVADLHGASRLARPRGMARAASGCGRGSARLDWELAPNTPRRRREPGRR